MSTTNWGAFNLPLELSPAGMPNCFLYTDVRWSVGLVIAGGTATWDATVPSTSDWIGRSFVQQIFVLDPDVPGLGAVMSNANEGVIDFTPPDVRLDTDMPGAASSWGPKIAASDDKVFVTWRDSRNGLGDIYFNRSLDGGVTWLLSDFRVDTDMRGTGSSWNPQIAAAGSSVYVTWEDGRNGLRDIYFNRSPDGGLLWLYPDVRLDTDMPGLGSSSNPQIAASGSTVFVTWEDRRNGKSDIYFNRSIDGGVTWLSSDIRLDTDMPGAAGSLVPQIAASGDTVFVTWEDRRVENLFTSTTNVYFNRSLDGGATWLNSDIRLDKQPPGFVSARAPRIGTSGDSIFVTWEDFRNGAGDIYLNRSLDRGATWMTSDIRLDTDPPGASSSGSPEIAVSDNSVYVTWREFRHGQSDNYLNRSLDGGATWLPADIRLNTDMPGVADSGFPKIAASGSSVYVTWSDHRNGLNDIYFNQSLDGGVTWLPPDIRLDTDTPGADSSGSTQMAISAAFVYVTWQDRRNHVFHFETSDIYFNRVKKW